MATVRLQIRRGTASQWTSANPTLAAGEMGVETDTRKVKIGDGTTGWTSLNYIAADNPEISEIAQDAIDAALVAGTGIVKSYNDGANTITVSVDTSVIATKAELAEVAQDSIDQALTAGTGITKNYNDAANTLTVSVDTSVIADKTYADTKLALAGGTMSGEIAMATNKITGMGDPSSNQDAATKKYVDDEITNLGNNLNNTIGDYVPLSEKGTALGVATLDANIKVPLSQLTLATDYADNAALNAQVSAQSTASDALDAHNLDTTGVHGIPNTADLATQSYVNTAANLAQSNAETYADGLVTSLVNSAPSTLNTLNELATALGNDANFSTTLTNSLALKAPIDSPTFSGTVSLPSNIIINSPQVTGTATLPTLTSIGDVTHTEIGHLEGVNGNIQGQIDTKLASADAAGTYAPIDGPTFTGTVTLPATTHIGDVSNTEIGYLNGVTSSVQGQIDAKLASADAQGTYAPLAAPTFTGNVTLPSTTSIGDVDATEISYINGVTSAIQGQIDSKAPIDSPTFTGTVTLPNGTVTSTMIAATTIATSNIADTAITADKLATNSVTNAKLADDAVDTAEIKDGAVTSAKIADGTIVNADISATAAIDWTKLAISSTVSATELGYVDGVTSAIQTQLDAKLASATAASTYAPIASPTFTGTVSGVSKSMVGLANVDNTSDADKPVSTATQTALDAKLSLAGGTMTGDLTLAGAPTQDAHAATKAYVDNVSAGINFHQPVRVATTGNITLSGTQTIDGVSVVAGDRVLVKDQTDQKTNGIYVVASGSWTRATDADNTPSGELAGGDFSLVLEGTVNSGYGYVCSNTSAITIGTTNITYAAFNAAKAVTAGTGLTETTPGTLAVDSSTVQYRVSGVSDTEIGYLDGVTSAIQTQIDTKAPTANPTFTGTVTVAASGVAFTDGTQTKEGVPSRTYIYGAANSNSIASSTTLSTLAYRDSLIECSNATGTDITLTVPTNASAAFPIGTSFDIVRMGASAGSAGAVTIAGASGVTVNATPGLKLRAQYSSATLLKRGTDSWLLLGDLTA